MSDRDFEYFQRREQNERACAERSRDQAARLAHLDMAERYAARLRAMGQVERLSSAA